MGCILILSWGTFSQESLSPTISVRFKEFKIEAVKQVTDKGHSVTDVER
jgi:transposase-like protein